MAAPPRFAESRTRKGLPPATAAWDALWIVDAASLAATVLSQAIRPTTWRAPVREQFVAALDREGVGGVRAVTLLASLTGLVLLSQGLLWLQELGQPESVRALLLSVIMQQFAPLTVSVLLLGRSALPRLGYMQGLCSGGALRGLAARGVGATRYHAVPVCLALATASACLTAVFVAVSVVTGFLTVELLGLTGSGAGGTVVGILAAIALSGPQWALLKSLLLGFVIGVVVFVTAFSRASYAGDREQVVSRGFFRGLLAVLTVDLLLSALGLL